MKSMDSAISIYKNTDTTTNMQYPEALIFMARLKEDAEDFKEAVVAGKTATKLIRKLKGTDSKKYAASLSDLSYH